MEAKNFLEELSGGPITFSDSIRAYRSRMELTQDQLGKKLGVSKNHIKELEKGQRLVSVEKAAKYANILQEMKEYYVKLALQDQVNKARLNYIVNLKISIN